MRHLLALLLACTTLGARADIIYEWVGNNDAAPFNIAMRLTFTDTAFDDGMVDLRHARGAGPRTYYPDSELLSLVYTTPGLSGTINFQPVTNGLGNYNDLRVQFTVDADGLLGGSLYANNDMLHVGMSGFGGNFQVTTANSDLAMIAAGCPAMGDCHGATGRFTRLAAPGNVPDNPLPEPMTLGLTTLSLLGMCYSRRRVATRTSAANG
jgi:hypothetical protein